LHKPIGLKFVQKYLVPDIFARLEEQCLNGAAFVWGSKVERSHQTYRVAGREALFLFRRGASVYKFGVVLEKVHSEPLALSLWGRDADGETWPTVYFFARIADKLLPAARVNELLGRSPKDNWQGLVVLTMKESEKVDEFFRRQLAEP
jgi:hypothetical protein